MNVAINGFGRIGRLLTRLLLEQDAVNLTLINGIDDFNNANYYLNYDSSHPCKNDRYKLDPAKVTLVNDRIAPKWQGIDLMIDCTGTIKKKSDVNKHIKEGGAKRVLVANPCDDVKNIVFGINQEDIEHHDEVFSASSCTTNCLAPMVQLLSAYEIDAINFTTVHAVTNDQSLLDKSHKDLRRSRSAMGAIIPTSSGASHNIGTIFPHLREKIQGYSVRVPVQNVSLIEMNVVTNTPVDLKKIIKTIKARPFRITDYVDAPVVSGDLNHTTASCIFDLGLIVSNNNLTKICAWYDNEWAYVNRLLDLIYHVQSSF